MADNLAIVPELKAGQDVILPIEKPIKPEVRAHTRAHTRPKKRAQRASHAHTIS